MGEGFPKGVFEELGQCYASLRRALLGGSQEVIRKTNGRTHDAKTSPLDICMSTSRGLAPWLLAQLAVMPIMGMPVFSGSAAMATGSLIGHLVYGAVLGAIYGAPQLLLADAGREEAVGRHGRARSAAPCAGSAGRSGTADTPGPSHGPRRRPREGYGASPADSSERRAARSGADAGPQIGRRGKSLGPACGPRDRRRPATDRHDSLPPRRGALRGIVPTGAATKGEGY